MPSTACASPSHLPNGAGLQGLLTIAELRQLHPRIPVGGGSWAAVGNRMGTLQNVQWSGDLSGSPFLTALQGASAEGLAVKLTVDLHQNNPKNVFTSGDLFCYGRVLGSIGPALAGELAQVVPGRYLPTFSGPTSAAVEPAPATRQVIPRARVGVALQAEAIGAARDATSANAAAAPPAPWNPAFAVVRQSSSQALLNIDIGGCILLNGTRTLTTPAAFPPTEHLKLTQESPLACLIWRTRICAVCEWGRRYRVQYQPLESTSKNCNLVTNSGVFTIPLTEDEANSYQTNPLAIQVNSTTVVQENADGLWADVSVSSQRLECGGGQTVRRKSWFACSAIRLAGTNPPVTIDVQLVEWLPNASNPTLSPSTDVGMTIGQTDANGLADITTSVNVPDITLSTMRQPLDSQVYYISLTDPLGNAIGDGPTNLFQFRRSRFSCGKLSVLRPTRPGATSARSSPPTRVSIRV